MLQCMAIIVGGMRTCSWADMTPCWLQDGVRETGVSVALTVRAMDAGPVLAQERIGVDADVRAPELLRDLFKRGTRCGCSRAHPDLALLLHFVQQCFSPCGANRSVCMCEQSPA